MVGNVFLETEKKTVKKCIFSKSTGFTGLFLGIPRILCGSKEGDTQNQMFQLIDAVETYERNGRENARQCVTLIGKNLDGKMIIKVIRNIDHEVFVAVNENFHPEQAYRAGVKLNEALLKSKTWCKRTECSRHPKNEETSEFGERSICTHACAADRQTDEQAVRRVDLVRARGFIGYEAEERLFAKFVFTRSYYCSWKLRKLIPPLIQDQNVRDVWRGIYELSDKCVDNYINNIGKAGFEWFSEVDGTPISEALAPPMSVNVPLKELLFDIETPSDQRPFPTADKVPIASIQFKTRWDDHVYYYCTVGQTTGEIEGDVPDGTETIVFDTEYQMLEKFHRVFMQMDPDVVAGYYSNSFDMPYIVDRMKLLGMRQWNQWSRLPNEPLRYLRTEFTSKGKGTMEKTLIYCPGRMFVDIKELVKNDMGIKPISKKLGPVALSLDNPSKPETNWWKRGGKDELPVKELHPCFHGDAKARGKFRKYGIKDVMLLEKVMDKRNYIGMVRANCRVFCVLPRENMERGISYMLSRKVYWLTYGRFLRRDEAVPLIIQKCVQEMLLRAKKYEGGLVQDPDVGFVPWWVFVLDFASLYPSTMWTHNYCPTTCMLDPRDLEGMVEGVDYEIAKNGVAFLHRDKRLGVMPQLCALFMDMRKQTKNLIKGETDPEKIKALGTIEQAYKLAANSTYGNAGMAASDMALLLVADAVCSRGRWYITEVIKYLLAHPELQQYLPKLKYGDTDSVFIALETELELEQARAIFKRMEELLKDSGIMSGKMEIVRDKLAYKSVFVCKKYYIMSEVSFLPGYSDERSMTIKGFQFKKGDAIPFAKGVGTALTEMLVMGEGPLDYEAIANFMGEKCAKLLSGELPREQYLLSQKLTKKINDYKAVVPHVSAAIRLEESGELVCAGDIIQYYFCAKQGWKLGNDPLSAIAIPESLVEGKDLNLQVYFDRFASTFNSLIEAVLGIQQARRLFRLGNYSREMPYVESRLGSMLGVTTDTKRKRIAPRGGGKGGAAPGELKQRSLSSFFNVKVKQNVLDTPMPDGGEGDLV